jgi:sugar-specific transcriptional regulator TrmB
MPHPHQETLILNSLRYFQAEYTEGVPLSILKLDLDLDDEQLHEAIHSLKSRGTITFARGKVKMVEAESKSPDEVVEEFKMIEKTPETRVIGEVSVELSQTERESLLIIKKLADESGFVSRHLLEGHLLYGDLKLSNLKIYNLLNSLQNKGLLSKTHQKDGTYYRLLRK